MEKKNALPTIIRTYREEKGYTQEQLSRLIHKSEKYIGAVECGRISPPFMVLKKIVQVLEIDGNSLFYDNLESDLSKTANIYICQMDAPMQNLALEILRTMLRTAHNKKAKKNK